MPRPLCGCFLLSADAGDDGDAHKNQSPRPLWLPKGAAQPSFVTRCLNASRFSLPGPTAVLSPGACGFRLQAFRPPARLLLPLPSSASRWTLAELGVLWPLLTMLPVLRRFLARLVPLWPRPTRLTRLMRAYYSHYRRFRRMSLTQARIGCSFFEFCTPLRSRC